MNKPEPRQIYDWFKCCEYIEYKYGVGLRQFSEQFSGVTGNGEVVTLYYESKSDEVTEIFFKEFCSNFDPNSNKTQTIDFHYWW